MERTDSSGNSMGHANDFSLHDFIDEANFEQFISLIRGDGADPNYDCEHINGCWVDNQFGPTLEHQFEFNTTTVSDPNSIFVNSLAGDIKERSEEHDAEESSATMTTTGTTTTKRSTKGDRARTLVSERRRRGRMKEKLYALRSLVPNITKMDKASIVGDAALYVQELQMQAKKLRGEIAALESTLTDGADSCQGSSFKNNAKKIRVKNLQPTILKKIVQLDVFQVEERGFYARLVCNKGQGVAASLYKALESFTGLNVESSNLATVDENFVLTVTLKVKERQLDMNLPNLKLWIAGALLNQGFDFKSSLQV
ncbi:hypothetical protein RJ640_022495 [Escallonia rubra]|uniref:BHLH domain-containing protein n=1 Tax=Escallonia rubra TaxID=112253 RepID=A0AA88UKH6_9ASTE|nr:hypothetical protein RJ640_022495 [Escallonia rubra]